LTNLIGSQEVSAFTEVTKDKKNPTLEGRTHSFQMKARKMMTYDAFSKLQKEKPLETNLMDKNLTAKLKQDIVNPPFYDNIADI